MTPRQIAMRINREIRDAERYGLGVYLLPNPNEGVRIIRASAKGETVRVLALSSGEWLPLPEEPNFYEG